MTQRRSYPYCGAHVCQTGQHHIDKADVAWGLHMRSCQITQARTVTRKRICGGLMRLPHNVFSTVLDQHIREQTLPYGE